MFTCGWQKHLQKGRSTHHHTTPHTYTHVSPPTTHTLTPHTRHTCSEEKRIKPDNIHHGHAARSMNTPPIAIHQCPMQSVLPVGRLSSDTPPRGHAHTHLHTHTTEKGQGEWEAGSRWIGERIKDPAIHAHSHVHARRQSVCLSGAPSPPTVKAVRKAGLTAPRTASPVQARGSSEGCITDRSQRDSRDTFLSTFLPALSVCVFSVPCLCQSSGPV